MGAATPSSTTVQGRTTVVLLRQWADHRPRRALREHRSARGSPVGPEQHPRDVLGNRGVSQQMPGSGMSVPRSAGVLERTSSLRRWPQPIAAAFEGERLCIPTLAQLAQAREIRSGLRQDIRGTFCDPVSRMESTGHSGAGPSKTAMKSLGVEKAVKDGPRRVPRGLQLLIARGCVACADGLKECQCDGSSCMG